MFGDLNRVELIGNVTVNPEIKYTASGTGVCSIGLATNRRYKQNEEWKEDTDFHNLVFWAKKAEQIASRAKKGTRVYVEGRLTTRSWEGEDGKKNYKTEIVVNNFILLDRYEKGPNAGLGGNTTSNNSDNNISSDDLPAEIEVISDDDLPF